MDKKHKSVGILALGSAIPNKVITNFDLEKIIETSNEWIIKRTGISERRILEEDEPTFGLGVQAAQKAILNSGLTAEDIQLIIVATCTPDYMVPSMACMIQAQIGASNAAAFDLNAACTGFMYALNVGEQFVKSGQYKYVLVIAAEALSKATDWEDRNTCILFGDGAGAAIIGEVEEGYGIQSAYLGSDGSDGGNITIPGFHMSKDDLEKRVHHNKKVIWMDGSEVFKFAVKVMETATLKAIEDANISLDQVKMIVPHQANIRIIEGASKRLDIPMKKLFTNLHKYGNVSAASVAIALDEAIQSNAINKGDYIILVAFGGGLTWGSMCIRWNL